MAKRSSWALMADRILMRFIPAGITRKSSSTPSTSHGDDMRQLPLSMRKTNLARLLARRSEGIFIAPFEQGEIGPDLFRKACEFGLEGLVSKRRESALPTRTLAALGEGEEPQPSGNVAGVGTLGVRCLELRFSSSWTPKMSTTS